MRTMLGNACLLACRQGLQLKMQLMPTGSSTFHFRAATMPISKVEKGMAKSHHKTNWLWLLYLRQLLMRCGGSTWTGGASDSTHHMQVSPNVMEARASLYMDNKISQISPVDLAGRLCVCRLMCQLEMSCSGPRTRQAAQCLIRVHGGSSAAQQLQ